VKRAPRILFFQRAIAPEHSAVGLLVSDLAEDLVRRGWEVAVAGTRSSSGVADADLVDGVAYRRRFVRPVNRGSLASRAVLLPATWAAMFGALRAGAVPDILVTLTDPPLLVCAGAAYARRHGCRHVHWCQDLYPEVAAAAGVVSGQGPIFRFLQWLSRRALRRCDRVVAVGRCMQQKLAGVSPELITNWGRADEGTAPPPQGFHVLYSGNLGRAHDFEGLQAAAGLTQGRGIRWTVCGSGPQADVPRPPVERKEPVSWEEFPRLLASASAHLITLRSEFCGLVVPSKIYDAAASARPLIFAGPEGSECALAIREAGMGLVVPDRDGPALAAAALRLAGDPGLCRKMSLAALGFSARHRLTSSGEAFDRLLREVLCRRREPGG